MKTRRILSLQPLVLAVALAYSSCSYADGSIDLLDFAGATTVVVRGLSSDGSIVAGNAVIGGDTHPVIWNKGVLTDLHAVLSSVPTVVQVSGLTAMSADGNVLTGQYLSTNGNLDPFRYQINTNTFATLNGLNGDMSVVAKATSADGTTIVGQGCGTGCMTGFYHAVIWQGGSTNATALPNVLSAQLGSEVKSVNKDGSVVVGFAADGFRHAAYWSGGAGYDLGTIAGPIANPLAEADGVSDDGKVVVGFSTVSAGNQLTHATLWNVPTPLAPTAVDLGALEANGNSEASAVSGNGKVVVGDADFNGGTTGFRWTQATGMQTIVQWLSNAGVTVPAGWDIQDATSVSQDGSVVAGGVVIGGRFVSWLGRVSETGSGLIDIARYNASVMESAARAVQAGVGLSNLALFGAHHRSILDSGLARSGNGACAWATADATGDNRTDTRSQLAEAGVCKDIGNTRLGIGVGQAWSQQDWSDGGSARYHGRYLILEGATAFDNGLQPSVTAYLGRFGTSMDRHYDNAGSIDSSHGSPDANSYAVRARLDWKDAARLGKFSLSPYAAYTWMKTSLDGYTETGGGFPAQFAASSWNTSDVRIGTAAKTALSGQTDLRLGLEGAHRMDGSTAGANGQVIGLWSFAVPGQSVNQTWARVTADLDHRFSDSILATVGASLASPGGDAKWGVTAGVRASF